ncbi:MULTISPECIES: HNH endonuclease signature motif containing protein [Chryseobacterium]|uniref:HNH endonuclease n=1 Tax=Candidatus Chryseobacterium massiliense TaxID=204089 RepID=A0A3D9AZ80_9FLAO|nr:MULTISPECIES: HNH endonuclease signature motif containing protein [Chryseobacterium]REC46675.1 hypothetical protein DRF68_14185 [Candidatus Chryseobacterium massiliae]
MRKINYPYKTDIEKEIFLNEYFDKIFPEISNHVEMCEEIEKIDVTWNLKKLLTADFCQLVDFAKKNNVSNLNSLFRTGVEEKDYIYSKLQRVIADFLIEKNVNIKSCFYCNIEYVNDFKDKYSSIDEFINYAPNKLLNSIISVYATDRISNKRKSGFIFEKDLIDLFPNKGTKITQKLNDSYKDEFNNEHFTLDHVLPKNSNAFLSISIFNLVPCCYSCNSKFKLTKEFSINNNLKSIVPSSKDYLFDNLIKFKLKYKGTRVENVKDIDVRLLNLSKIENVDEFIAIFRLQSRYNYHKNISYDMIQKRKIYSDSQIEEIAILLKRDEQSVKKDLFGKECFESSNEPFEKYKQDIAEQLGII